LAIQFSLFWNDLAGLPKDHFYLYKSRWNTERINPSYFATLEWEGREGKQLLFCTQVSTVPNFYKWQKHGVQKKKQKHTKPLSLNVDGCEI
jgi:beta-galactosidase